MLKGKYAGGGGGGQNVPHSISCGLAGDREPSLIGHRIGIARCLDILDI